MFTGIILDTGKIESLNRTPQGGKLRVNFSPALVVAGPLAVGASIAVNGCCLTAVELGDGFFAADLSGETLACTSFDEKTPGDTVNLERPLGTGSEMGGHFVQGHVDGIGRALSIIPEGANWRLEVSVPATLAKYIAEKGSLAVDGISLTVARLRGDVAAFAIIPFTFGHTNLAQMRSGDAVNLETDILAKYIERIVGGRGEETPSQLTVDGLRRQGF